jgi:hypothetical protein
MQVRECVDQCDEIIHRAVIRASVLAADRVEYLPGLNKVQV